MLVELGAAADDEDEDDDEEPQPAMTAAESTGARRVRRFIDPSPVYWVQPRRRLRAAKRSPLVSKAVSDVRPAIGICTSLEYARWGVWDERAALLPWGYMEAIQRAGGLVTMIPPDPVLVTHPERCSTASMG